MQLEAVEPAHGGTPRSGDALEDPMDRNALVPAYPHRGRVDEHKKLRTSQKKFKFEKRALWLNCLKENKFKTRHEFWEYLAINSRTQH